METSERAQRALESADAGNYDSAIKWLTRDYLYERAETLPAEDNIRDIRYRRSATGYLRLLDRLRQASEDGRRVYYIYTMSQGMMSLFGEYKRAVDITDAPISELDNQSYPRAVWMDNLHALWALAAENMQREERAEKIARVFPYIYPANKNQEITFSSRLAGLLSPETRWQNANIRLFQAAKRRLDAINKPLNLHHDYTLDGFLYMMYDISRGAEIGAASEFDGALCVFTEAARRIRPEMAQFILDVARDTFPPGVFRYSYPDELKDDA